VSIIKDGDQYYEAHTFLSSGTLSIDAVPDADNGLLARALVVAGGGSSSESVLTGSSIDGVNYYGNIGGEINPGESDKAGGGGGAGGAGKAAVALRDDIENDAGGPGRVNSINGTAVTYAAGGDVAPDYNQSKAQWSDKHGAPNTGNGGAGAWNGNGGSGIVIVRFPARPNEQYSWR
jgi:hypothetical protein